MSFASEVALSMVETLDEMGVSISFNGITKACVIGTLTTSSEMQDGGYRLMVDEECRMLDADFRALGLGFQDEPTVDGRVVRVVSISYNFPIVILGIKAVR